MSEMFKLKEIDLAILSELLTNSKRSDRQLAKKIGISQPTVTRRRATLEKELIDGYTAIPKWGKFGYKLLAITLVKAPLNYASEKLLKDTIEKSMKWLDNQSNVIFGGECRGMGMTGVMISLHKNYGELDEFLISHRQQLGNVLEDVNVIIVNLSGKAIYRPLHLKYLAKNLQKDKHT